MLQKPLIRLRNLKELQSSQKMRAESEEFQTPTFRKAQKKRATKNQPAADIEIPISTPTIAPTPSSKRVSKSTLKKEPPPNQLRINAFFQTCQKTYKIDKDDEPTPMIFRNAATEIKATKGKTVRKKSPRKMGRKRLFADETTSSSVEEGTSVNNKLGGGHTKKEILKISNNIAATITLISDSSEEEEDGKPQGKLETVKAEKVSKNEFKTELLVQREEQQITTRLRGSSKKMTSSRKENSPLPITSKLVKSSSTSPLALDSGTSNPVVPSMSSSTKRKPKACPPYKIIEGTTFAVDAFQYGCIEGVTHYFLTHFHADHYIGLTRKFAMPLYMSPITARFVRSFIPLDEQYIHEVELNTPITVDNIEITALDANHCPGAIMLLFKLPDGGKCILHTGDFRAWHGMESEPAFWNNDVATIYLDTTYISNKYAFCTQYESIERAKDLVQKFRDKHADKRILYICGSYVIGKEKFWSSVAEEFELKVWTEENRRKALKALDDKSLNKLLIEEPLMADMHVLTMGKISYLTLVDYFSTYENNYDILLAIRPSGWEKDSRPQYRGKINIIGVEYSEHSSYDEMQRFVKFLKPKTVISTVPTGRDLMLTARVPEKWYKYEKLQSSSNYQPRIEQFMGKTPQKKACIRLPNANKGGVDTFVSPLSKKHTKAAKEINNNGPASVISLFSSENEFEPTFTSSRPAIKEEKLEYSQNLRDSTQRQRNAKTSSKTKKTQEISNSFRTKLKEEKLESSQKLRNSPKIVKSNPKSVKVAADQKARKEITNKSAMDHSSDLVLSQKLEDGECCSIFIPTAVEPPSQEYHAPASTQSSDYFEMPLLKNRNRRVWGSPSCAEELTPVTPKRNSRTGTKKLKPPNIMPSTKEENESELESDAGDSKICMVSIPAQVLKVSKPENKDPYSDYLDMPTTSKMAKLLAAKRGNPLLKSTTTSCASSVNEEVAASQTSDDLENTPRPLRSKHLNGLENGIIPASQTSKDLENTPRPLRNKKRQAFLSKAEVIHSSQNSCDFGKGLNQISTLSHLRDTKRDPLLDNFSQNEIIPASQTSKDLENTPRPIRNKRSKTLRLSLAASTPKKARESPPEDKYDISNDASSSSISPNRFLTQILKENKTIDVYNTSQLANIVAETLADQQPDKSLDHIPPELLSDPDAEDDWLY